MSKYKYRILMHPADSDRTTDVRIYTFNDVNDIFMSLMDEKNPINAALRREGIRELASPDYPMREYILNNFEDWIEHEFTNVISDIQFYIGKGVKTWTYWNIVHELEVLI